VCQSLIIAATDPQQSRCSYRTRNHGRGQCLSLTVGIESLNSPPIVAIVAEPLLCPVISEWQYSTVSVTLLMASCCGVCSQMMWWHHQRLGKAAEPGQLSLAHSVATGLLDISYWNMSLTCH
jgi:hypothetical protein